LRILQSSRRVLQPLAPALTTYRDEPRPMAAAPFAPHKRSEQPRCWLRAIARAALGWAFVCLTTLLLSHLSQVSDSARAFLIAAVVLCAGGGLGLMLLAAAAVRDRR
jgi:hypothetical protein